MKTFWTILCFVVYVNMDTSGPFVLASSSSHPSENSERIPADATRDGTPPEMLQELLWFFRREDPSTWSYCILGLSFLVLVIGVGLLGANIKANRARKVALVEKGGDPTGQPEETEMKQAFMLLKDDGSGDPLADNSLPKMQDAGQVTIQWKDGNVTNLYEDKPEMEA